MRAINISRGELVELYVNEGLPMQKIADKLGCSQGLIWKKVHEFGIKARTIWNATDLSKEKLATWYIKEGLSTWEIEKQYGYSRGTVHRKLKEFGLVTRNASESHIRTSRKDFDGTNEQKAYLIGFARGDLRVRQRGESIYVACGSTKPAQIELIKNLFSSYGNVWIGKPKDGRVNIEAGLNNSFSFLLGKAMPEWVYLPQNFFAFFAGFSDAEGCIAVNNSHQAYFSLGNYNKEVLQRSRVCLERAGIPCRKLAESKIKGRICFEKYRHRQNYWHLTMSRKIDLLKLFELLEPYIQHTDKKAAMQVARENIYFRNAEYGNLKMNESIVV